MGSTYFIHLSIIKRFFKKELYECCVKSKKWTVSLSEQYQSGFMNSAFLLHSTGHKQGGSEIDCSINYASYYYLEELLRLQNIKN